MEHAQLITLSVPLTTALMSGPIVTGVNTAGSTHGMFTERDGQHNDECFVDVLNIRHARRGVEVPKSSALGSGPNTGCGPGAACSCWWAMAPIPPRPSSPPAFNAAVWRGSAGPVRANQRWAMVNRVLIGAPLSIEAL